STLARVVMRLAALQSGQILFEGEEIGALSRRALARQVRPALQMVFQDPYASLNPRMRVGDALVEPLRIHGRGDRARQRTEALAMLARVGLAAEAAARYPHEFSGGQRQRIAIARALMLRPRLLVCDEAVSALDVSVRAQVLNLLLELRSSLGLALLFISHDLAVVRHLADRVAVMRAGRIVEQGRAEEIWSRPSHLYTRALLAAAAGEPASHPH
ncbi:MAG TPA: ABC transporter ATP-binding protein, partial [Roseateles sp.]|nr:ABC transporter ATP-binding protein [Roseateles sp.]